MSKRCKYCSAELPDEASFCPHCARSQIEKEFIKTPASVRKRILTLCVILAEILAAVLLIMACFKPKTYDNGGAQIVYDQGRADWHFLLRNSVDGFHWQTAQGMYSRMCTAGTQAAVPLQLYVYDEETGKSAAEEFLKAMDSSEVAAFPRDGAVPMECSRPASNPGFAMAALESDVVFTAGWGTNDIVWTIHMKNGDTILLHEVVEILVNPEVSYTWETTPLGTTEEVKALLERIEEEVEDPDTVVNITLAPVEYEGDLNIMERTVNLKGSSDGENSTVIKGCLTVDSRIPAYVVASDLTFEGEGTGIFAKEGFRAVNCTFRGKDVGVYGAEGSWPILEGCTFENCGIGWHFNSSTSTMRSALVYQVTFKGNGTGVLFEKVPGTDVFYFLECTFEDNGRDIENFAGNEISFTLDTGKQ